ncbi:MAG: hypothetical protein DHS20C18_40740 [Saprospiraceae bacterium]|nr:MAG: hypothetical protein DHS20C18_40740 [Saprospiraceae bacterium]
MLRNHGVFLFLLFFIHVTALFGARKPYVFVNNTGKEVNDIHIVFTTEGVEIEEPNAHSKIEDHINKRFPIDDTDQNDPNAIHRKGNLPLPNGGVVYGVFKKNGRGPIKIRQWWWTYDGERIGEIQNGDEDKTQQSGSLVVPGEDIVRGISLKNKVKDFEIKDNKWEPKEAPINDLHVVFKGENSPDPINKEKANAEDTPKYGGKFEEFEKVTCSCDELPPFTQKHARERALSRLDEPCKSLCKNADQRLHVIHFRNGSMPKGSEIDLKFRSNKDFELTDWWWTRDGKPITFIPDDKVNPIKLGDTNAPPKTESKHKEGNAGKDEGRKYDDHVISYRPLRLEGGGQFSTGYRPEGGANLPTTEGEILKPLYNDPVLFEKLFERLGGEFFVEEPVKNYAAKPGIGINLRTYYPLSDRLLIGLGFNYQKTKINGTLPLQLFSTGPGTEGYAANLSTQFHYYMPDLKLRYLITQSKLALYGEVSIGAQFIRAQDVEVELAGVQYILPYSFKHNALNAGLEAGVNYTWNNWLYTGIRSNVNFYKGADGKINNTTGVGMHLGVKLSR